MGGLSFGEIIVGRVCSSSPVAFEVLERLQGREKETLIGRWLFDAELLLLLTLSRAAKLGTNTPLDADKLAPRESSM